MPLQSFSKGRIDILHKNITCIFDLLNFLAEREVLFYPYHPKFIYKKTELTDSIDEKYPVFFPEEKGCPFSLVRHSSKLNVSISMKIDGTVQLKTIEGKKPSDLGLTSPRLVSIFRTFTLIKDGKINVEKIYISAPKGDIDFLVSKGLVTDINSGIFELSLSKLPVIDKKEYSITKLCDLAYKEQELKGIVKSLKFLRKENFKEDLSAFTPEQIDYLWANGIKDDIFCPPTKQIKEKEESPVKCFEVKIAGLSSLPTVQKVLDKIEAEKPRNLSESLVEKGIQLYNTLSKKEQIDSKINSLEKELQDISKEIQAIKFTIALNEKWYEMFSGDQVELELENRKFKLDLCEKIA